MAGALERTRAALVGGLSILAFGCAPSSDVPGPALLVERFVTAEQLSLLEAGPADRPCSGIGANPRAAILGRVDADWM